MVSHSHHGSHGSSKENAGSGGKSSATAAPAKENWKIERVAGKDGAAQRAAADVEGLKGYQLGDCLGKGAFGSVYKALNWGTGGTVAIKQVGLSHLPKTELKNMMQEIDLLKNLHHPNIVKYHGFVTSTENLYIILEYCEGGSLNSMIKNFGKFPETLVALYLSQVLQGLLYLHEQGVIHRDIKGANILVMRDGLVKLADFGVATKGNAESTVVGTPYWMAPEVIQLSGASTASDIWSLGCTAIELLDGKPPYSNFQPMPALFRIVNDDHPPLPEGASPVVRDFLMQCFQKDPNLRVSAKKLLKHPWIVNAKRADAVPTAKGVEKPTQQAAAQRTIEEWNAALQSPEAETRRGGGNRQASLSPAPVQREPKPLQLTTPGFAKAPVAVAKSKPSLDALASPELDADDNWDLDFDPPSSPRGLQLQRLKPQDHFAGMFSHERLKSLAQYGSMTEEIIEEEPDLTVRNTVELSHIDPLETVRPFTPQKPKKKPEIKSVPPNTGSQRIPSQPKVPPLREPARKVNLPAGKLRLTAPQSRPTSIYQEESDEDFSDMLDDDEDDAAFQRKLQELRLREESSFSPRLFHPSDLKNPPKSVSNGRKSGSLRRYPTPDEQMLGIHRSRSSVEIQKYAEDENEDPEDFLGKDVVLPVHDSDSGSEPSTLMMLNSKLSTNSWLGDEDEDDDPFAQLEEDFDELDLETNIARDRHARLCKFVEELVGEIKKNLAPDALAHHSEQLMQVLIESPELKGVIISSHGMLPILEILDTCQMQDVILRLLKIVNMIIYENEELMETLCFLGGIPIISRFADQRVSAQIRLEAAAFVRQMCQGSTLTLQMFIGCGGLNVLCDFLEEDLETERDLVLIGVMGVYNVFELQGSTPKNDFCRILSRNNILYPLSLVLNKVLYERSELSEQIEGRIVHIFHIFSQAENYVKENIADNQILKRVLKDLRRMSPVHQITMLKFIKNLSMLDRTHEALESANAIEILAELLSSSKSKPNFLEISNQILNTIYNLCRLSHERQAEAAHSGLIPILQDIVWTERPLKEFALPILCDMAHSGKMCRKILWSNRGLQFYVKLLSDKYWQVTALDAIFVWLQEETARVEQHLLSSSDFSRAIVECFTNPEASPDAFENFLDPLQKMLRISPSIAKTLAHPELFAKTARKFETKKAVVKLNLLRIIKSICDANEEHGGATLIRAYGLQDAIIRLKESDPAILVREMASELLNACETGSRRTFDGAVPRARAGLRRASSSTANMTSSPGLPMSMAMPPPSLLTSQSMPVDKGTPRHIREARSSYFERRSTDVFDASNSSNAAVARRDRMGSSSSLASLGVSGSLTSGQFRPISRDGASGDRTRERGFSGNSDGGGVSIVTSSERPPPLPMPRVEHQWGHNTPSSGTPSSGTPSAASASSAAKSSRLPRTSAGTRMTRLSLAGTKNRLKSTAGQQEGTVSSSSSPHSTPTHVPGSLAHTRLHTQAQAGAGTPGSRTGGSGLNPLGRRRRQTSADIGLGRQGL